MRRIFLTLLFLSFTLISFAQEDIRGDIDIFGSTEIAFVFTQTTTGGSLSENEDGTYSLSLEAIPAQTTIVQVSPPGAVTYDTAQLAQDWTNAIELAATSEEAVTQLGAELNIAGDVLVVVLNSATYDAESETMTYVVEIMQFIPFSTEFSLEAVSEDLDKATLPTSFDAATLTISATQEFWNSLQSGAEVRRADIRDNLPEACTVAEEVLNNPEDYTTAQIYAARNYFNNNCQ